MTLNSYKHLTTYYGDLHNHCGVSYGRGSLEDAFTNARQQLDFASVTVHAHWPDIPRDQPRLDYLVDYHERGFEEALARWSHYQDITDRFNAPGAFVTFPSFEWHSMRYGDHCIYFKDTAASHIIPAQDIEALREHLRALSARGIAALMIPHHIGYLRGYRGINWETFSEEFSPVVEIVSFHGVSEHSEAPFPYLHSMGPRDERSTVQYGLRQGHIFGFIGSTDHHGAHPGHYNYGRLGVWAEDLTRGAIWDAIRQRRTYALTGDRITLQVALNGQPMGSLLPATPQREIAVSVQGGDALDVVEVLHNNQVIHRWHPPAVHADLFGGPVQVLIEVGWGEEPRSTEWEIDLAVENGELLGLEPRWRGHGIEPPPQDIADRFVLNDLQRPAPHRFRWQSVTWRNPTVTTPATQGLNLTLRGSENAHLVGHVNGQPVRLALGELVSGARVRILNGFVSPAVCFHRVVPQAAANAQFTLAHEHESRERDWYYVRVRQRNGQSAWSSPHWVEGT